VFVPAEYELFAFKLLLDGAGNPSLGGMWTLPGLTYPGGSLIVANNVLYWAYSATQTGSGNVKALNPTTGATLWTSSAIGGIHWQSPVVANGVVYITDNAGHVTAFGLPSGGALSRTGWTGTASSTGGADVPARALDGTASTRWSTGAAQTNGQWFKVDMKASFQINKLTLDNTASPSDYPRGYSVTLSADDVTYGAPVATGAGSGTVTTITFATQPARFIKITQTGTASSWWSIHELNVFGTGGAPTLTAYPRTGWVASAQHTNGTDVVANALDGNSATRWSDGTPQSTMTSPAQYFQVDMGVSQPFSQLTLDSAGSTGDYLRNYQVLVGNTSPPTTSIVTGTGTAALTTITFPSTTARYIRVVQTAASSGVGSWWSIAELNVWH
jgi:beta-glucosidase